MKLLEADPKIVERLVRYLKNKARHGEPLPRNLARAASNAIGTTGDAISRARNQLVKERRLRDFHYSSQSIDGIMFLGAEVARDEYEITKMKLRKFYPIVVDLRTVMDERAVARGKPTALIVGAQVISYSEACLLADRLLNSTEPEPPGPTEERDDADNLDMTSEHPEPEQGQFESVPEASASGLI